MSWARVLPRSFYDREPAEVARDLLGAVVEVSSADGLVALRLVETEAVAQRGADHVLSRLPKSERDLLDIAIVTAADAVEVLLAEGPDAAMRRFNGSNA